MPDPARALPEQFNAAEFFVNRHMPAGKLRSKSFPNLAYREASVQLLPFSHSKKEIPD
jgi:hypothetical protein